MTKQALGSVSLVILVVALLTAACTSSDTSRLPRAATTEPEDEGEVTVDAGSTEITLPPTTQASDPARSLKKSPNQEKNCTGTADSFIPESGEGWEIMSADASRSGAEVDLGDAQEKGLESIGAAYFAKGSTSGSVVSMVFEPGMAGLLSASTDVVMRGMFAAEAVEKGTVEGNLVYYDTDEKMFAFQFCNNVYMTVQSSQPGVAREITEYIL